MITAAPQKKKFEIVYFTEIYLTMGITYITVRSPVLVFFRHFFLHFYLLSAMLRLR